MVINWRYLLAGAAAAFILFLLVKMRPTLPLRAVSNGELRAARERAKAASSPREKAEALCDAGAIAAQSALRFSATGYFLRAMRADPTWAGAVERAALAFERRPRLLERVLWKRLADLPWDDAHEEVLRACSLALRDIYDGRLRDRVRAEFMGRFASRVGRADGQ